MGPGLLYVFSRKNPESEGWAHASPSPHPRSAPTAPGQSTGSRPMPSVLRVKALKNRCRRTEGWRLVCGVTCIGLCWWNHGSVLVITGICEQNISYFSELRAKWNVITSQDERALRTDVRCFVTRTIAISWRMAKFHSVAQEINTGTVWLQLCAPGPWLCSTGIWHRCYLSVFYMIWRETHSKISNDPVKSELLIAGQKYTAPIKITTWNVFY